MIINNLNLLNNTYVIIDLFLRQQIAKLYTEDLSFLLGDFCIYNNQLYQCIEDTSGDWDLTKWENKKITNIENSIIYYIDITESNKMESIYYKTVTEYSGEQRYIGSYAFSGCTSLLSVSFPVCTSIGSYAFSDCTSLQSISFPVCTSIGSYAFYNCSSLQSASFPVCTSIGSRAFDFCSSLQSVNFPMCSYIDTYAFGFCSSLQSVNFPMCSYIDSNAFTGCNLLQSIILLTSSVCALANKNAFYNTPMSKSTYTGTFGSIYVPTSLVASYKTATNWTIYSDRIIGV